MAAPSTVKVFNVLRQQDGTPLVNANVHLILDYNQATVTATGDDIIDLQQSATTDATGTYTFTVVPTDLMSPSNLTYTVVEPNRTYQIAPLSTGGASQQTTAVGVIVNQPGALAAATQNVTGPLTVQGALVAQSTFQAQGVTRLDADAQLHGPDPWFDVKHPSFGAKGDGTTDDTGAIQAAINAVPAGGGRMYFPPGTYKVSASLTITTSGTWLIGSGAVNTIISRSAAGSPTTDTVIFSAVGGQMSGMRDIEVNTTGGAVTGADAVSVLNSNTVYLDHVFTNGFRNGIKFTGSGDCVAEFCIAEAAQNYGFYVTTSDPIRLNNCEGFQNGYSFAFDTPRSPGAGTAHTYPSIASACTASEDASAGFYVNAYTDVTFADCQVMNKANAAGPTYGFWLNGTYARILIANPKLTRVKQYGIRCVTGGGGTVTIDNPQIDATGNYAALPAVSIYGILVESGILCNIVGGHVTNSQGYGISHQGTGQVVGTQVIDSSLANSSTQGLYALEVAPSSSGPIFVSGVYLLNNAGPRGTGVRVSNAANVVTFDHVTATGFSTAYDNNGGAGITRSLYACSFSNSVALDAFQALNGLQAGGGTLLTQVVVYSQTLTPVSTAAASAAEQTFTVNGLTTADKVYINAPPGANSCTPVSCRVTAANTIGITYMNPTAGALTSAAGVYQIVAVRS